MGGTERHVSHLAARLDPSRFEVHVACLQRQGGLFGEMSSSGLPLTSYAITSFLRPETLRQQRRFTRYLKDNAIDIVHAYGFYPIVFAVPAARLAGSPIVVASIRDNGDQWTAAQRFVQMCVGRLADCILVNAAAVRTSLAAKGYSRRAIAVIRNGVDVDRFTPRPHDEGLRVALGLPPRAPLIVVVSRLNPLKGVDVFLDAARILAKRFEELRFVIVGYGPSRDELQAKARRFGLADVVAFEGARLDVAAILSQATVSVAPSLSEAMPNVVLESMAAGAPIVATRVGGTPEVVEDEVNGLLVPPCDAPALATAIGRLLMDPALGERLGKAGRARMVDSFSVPRMVRETENLYTALLNGERTPAMRPESQIAMTQAPPRAVMARRRRELWELSRGWTPP